MEMTIYYEAACILEMSAESFLSFSIVQQEQTLRQATLAFPVKNWLRASGNTLVVTKLVMVENDDRINSVARLDSGGLERPKETVFV